MKLVKVALAIVFLLPSAAFADDPPTAETKPPIIVQQGNTRYIFTQQDEKFRSMLLNSKNLRIHDRRKVKPEDYYRNYYRHHKRIRDHENDDNNDRHRHRHRDDIARDSGYITGRILSD